MPAIFGLTCANFVLMSLANYPVPEEAFPVSSKLRPRLYADAYTALKSKYDSYGSSTAQPNCPFSVDDVGYIIEELFRGRSVLYPFHTSRLTLVQWQAEGPVTWGNVICLTKAEALEHEKRVLKGGEKVEGLYSPEVISRVDEIWKEERDLREVRWGSMYSTNE
jgi:tRNA threonylcarbamoyladenosine dehydratase